METNAYPILEFDPAQEAIIEPGKLVAPLEGMAEHCVICFFYDVFERFLEQGLLEEIKSLNSEMGRHPVYRLSLEGRTVTLFHPGVGASLAAGMLEGVIALGGASSLPAVARGF